MPFLFINKALRLSNSKSRTDINAKISVFVIFVEAIIYVLIYNLHECTFKLALTFCAFPHYKVYFVWDPTDLFSDVWIFRKLSIERTWWFEDQFYSGVFTLCNCIIGIISLLVVCDVKIWCKCSLFTSVFDITGKEVQTCIYRSCHPDVFYKKCVIKDFAKFTGKKLC